MDIAIRLARQEDLVTINAIYNYFVLNSTCTYQVQPATMEERKQWFAAHDERHPVTVAERDGRIVGWGSLSRFHPRAAYDRTVENSIYIHHEWHRQGIGRAILADLITRARQLQHHTILAAISADQKASVELHRAMGFETAGHLKQVGYKFSRWLDVVYLQRMLDK